MSSLQRCIRCGISENFPGIQFDDAGVCQHCNDLEAQTVEKQAKRLELDRVLAEERGAGEYDAVVAYSGGKDSSYLLWLLVEKYKLRPLAVTIDNGFLSPKTFENCHAIVDRLGIDYRIFRPASKFTSALYRGSLKLSYGVTSAVSRASSVCVSCIQMINTHVIKEALTLNAPIVAGGYLTGQLPRGGAVMKLSLDAARRAREHGLQKYEQDLGENARRYLALPEKSEQKALWLVNPLSIDYSEEHVLDVVKGLGWVRPVDTGLHSSNCVLNDLGIYAHLKRHGFHPYEGELTEQVRTGSMDRAEAIRRLEAEPTRDEVLPIAEALKIDINDL